MNSEKSLHLPNVQIIIGMDGDDTIQKMLQETGKFYCNTLVRTQINMLDEANAPDIFIIDIESITDIELELINNLNLSHQGVPIIVISEHLEEQQFRRLLQSNVQDWLASPVDANDLLNTLTKWSNLRKSSHNRVHAIVSAAGGVGASNLAVTLADMHVSKQTKKRRSTALVDLDFSLGNCGTYLNAQNNMDLAKLLKEPQRLDSEVIELMRIQHKSGLYIYSYKAPQFGINPNINEMTLRLLDLMSMSHDTSFLDIPYYEQPWKDHVLAAVDTVTIVTTSSIANIQHAHDLTKRVKLLRGDKADINIVINKHKKRWFGQRMDDARTKEVFEGYNVYVLPLDNETMEDAISQGISPYETNSGSAYVKQASLLADHLADQYTDGQVGA
jgi:pilus assembly protein CpaE